MLKDFRVLLILCLTVASLSLPASANEVVQWNETTLKAIEANGQGNVVATRTLAMVQVAVHDALNAVSRRYDAYYFEGPGDPAASPDAAVAAAAHTVLVGVVGSFGTPAQKGATLALVDQAYAASIVRVTDGPARNKGVAVGRAAGAAILTLRKDDARYGSRQVAPSPESGPAQPAHRQRGPGSRLRALGDSRLGERHAVHLVVGLAVLASRAAGVDERDLCA